MEVVAVMKPIAFCLRLSRPEFLQSDDLKLMEGIADALEKAGDGLAGFVNAFNAYREFMLVTWRL